VTAARTPAPAIRVVDDDQEFDQAIDSMLGDLGEASWEDEHTEVGELAFEIEPQVVDSETVLVPALRVPQLTPMPVPTIAPPPPSRDRGAHARELAELTRQRDEAVARADALAAELAELEREHAQLSRRASTLAGEVTRALRALRGDQR
jgi:hypothetical protein